jgi:hypothetical protein
LRLTNSWGASALLQRKLQLRVETPPVVEKMVPDDWIRAAGDYLVALGM